MAVGIDFLTRVRRVAERVDRHVRRLWPTLPLLPMTPLWVWLLVLALLGYARVDHAVVVMAATFLAYGNERTKQWFIGLLPFAAVGVLYDSMRFVQNLGLSPDRVHVCDVRAAELALFGVRAENGVRITLQDWFQAHHTAALDVLFAIPYGIYLYVVIGFALYLATRDFRSEQRYAWGFFLLNLMAFATYHIFPVAPPWYFHTHGCAVDLGALPSTGPNLARVDAMWGVRYFHGFYARSSDVFGAVPSLHVAYPLLMLVESARLRSRSLVVATVTFYVWMCVAAMYLDHHWMIDVVAGSAYACVAAVVMRRLIPNAVKVEAATTRAGAAH